MKIVLSIVAILTASAVTAAETERRHENIPLAVGEFLGTANARSGYRAYTQTSFRHEIRFSHQSNGRNTSAWLTSAEIYAVFLPDESWWSGKRDAKLLDHEQGHFDISEILAMEFQLNVSKQLARGKALLVTAKDADAAAIALEAKFGQMQKKYDERHVAEHERYDRLTNHGAKADEQAAHRRKHHEELRRLSRELAKLEKAATRK